MLFRDRNRTKNLLSIEGDKTLYSASRDHQDCESLQNAITHLYSRILELVDEALDLREQRTTLRHERDILSQRLLQLETELVQSREDAIQAQREVDERQARINELETLAGSLTEWNGSLELQCSTLTQSLLSHQQSSQNITSKLEKEILGVTEKQIRMREELDASEEENQSLRRSLREVGEVRDRFIQENAILKSKLYNIYSKIGDSPDKMDASVPSRFVVMGERARSRSMSPPELVDVELEKSGISDLLSQLKSYPIKRFIKPIN